MKNFFEIHPIKTVPLIPLIIVSAIAFDKQFRLSLETNIIDIFFSDCQNNRQNS